MQKIANISLFESIANRSGNAGLKWGYQEIDPDAEPSYGRFSDMDADDIAETVKYYSDRCAQGEMTKAQALKCLTALYGIRPEQIRPFMARYFKSQQQRAIEEQSRSNIERLDAAPAGYAPPQSKLQSLVADEQRRLNTFSTPVIPTQPTAKKPFFGKLKSLLRAASAR